MIAALLLAGALLGTAAPPPAELRAVEARLGAIAARTAGVVGFAALHLESGRSVGLRMDRPFPMHSVAKLPTAIVVLDLVARGGLRLDELVEVRREDVAPGRPEARARWADAPKRLSLERLLALSLEESDNTAHDRLLALAGGPAAVTRWLRARGLTGLRLDHTMKERQIERPPGHDAATPAAIVRLLARLERGELTTPSHRALILGSLTRSPLSPGRLKGRLPPGVALAHKTGTGRRGTNDVGLLTLPDGRGHLALAAFIDGAAPGPEQDRIIAELAHACFEAFRAEPRAAPGR